MGVVRRYATTEETIVRGIYRSKLLRVGFHSVRRIPELIDFFLSK